MRVLVSGSHGLIGSALVARLATSGHDVVRLTRGPRTQPQTVSWDPAEGRLDPQQLVGVDAVVHLAGEGIGDHRWTSAHLGRVLDSRVQGTTLLAQALSTLERRPAVLLSASAIGYYGDCGDEAVTESHGPGQGFLAEVCQQWEAATASAEAAGIRVAHLRTGVVLSPTGGALGKQLPLFRLGLGGRLGAGDQYLSWIDLDDAAGAIEFALGATDLHGPVNVTAPAPVTNAEFTKALGKALHRPAFLAVPEAALRLVMGRQMANEMVLSGARVLPTRLEAAGYRFLRPTLVESLTHIAGR